MTVAEIESRTVGTGLKSRFCLSISKLAKTRSIRGEEGGISLDKGAVIPRMSNEYDRVSPAIFNELYQRGIRL